MRQQSSFRSLKSAKGLRGSAFRKRLDSQRVWVASGATFAYTVVYILAQTLDRGIDASTRGACWDIRVNAVYHVGLTGLELAFVGSCLARSPKGASPSLQFGAIARVTRTVSRSSRTPTRDDLPVPRYEAESRCHPGASRGRPPSAANSSRRTRRRARGADDARSRRRAFRAAAFFGDLER